MELVAIYIKSYKKIKHLLIPLSSAFDCYWDNSNLSVKKINNLRKYYQGNNYSLILGQNGTGKTTIIDFIESLYSSIKGEGLGIFYDGEKYSVHSNLASDPPFLFDSKINSLNFQPNNMGCLLSVNNIFDVNKFVFRDREYQNKSFLKMTANTLTNKGRKRAFIDEVSREADFFENNGDFLKSIGNPHPSFTFKMYSPAKSRYSSVVKNMTKNLDLLDYELNYYLDNFNKSLINEYLSKDESRGYVKEHFPSNIFREKTDHLSNDSEEKYLSDLKVIGDQIFNKQIYKITKKNYDDTFWQLIMFFLSDILWKIAGAYFSHRDDRDYFYISSLIYTLVNGSNIEEDGDNYIPEKLSLKLKSNENPYYDFTEIGNIIHEVSSLIVENDISLINTSEGVTFTTNDSSLISDFSHLFGGLNQFIVTSVEFGWSGFSSGESALVKLFARTFNGLERLRSNKVSNYILTIDEVDLYLHPEWQRSFLKRLLLFINHIKLPGEFIQVILSSHSPLIASDFLPEDIVTLVKQGDGVEVAKQSTGFGASINQLYTNSFSLDSTIGEYSRDLLGEIINKVKTHDLSHFEKELISRIGDDLIREKLTEYINYDLS